MAFEENKEDVVQLIGFYIGQRFFGADILTVREILRDPDIETLDDAPQAVSGITKLRGQVIPIIDLNRRLGYRSGENADGKKWLLVTQIDDMVLGFNIDAVTRIFRIDPHAILPAPEIILSAMANQYIRGVYESEQGMLIVLQLNQMLDGDEIKALKKLNLH